MPRFDQQRHDYPKTAFRQPSGELLRRCHARLQTSKLLGRPVGIAQRDHRAGCVAQRLQQQAFAIDAIEHRPADLVNTVAVGFGHEQRIAVDGNPLQPRLHARVRRADDLDQSLPVFGNRRFVGFWRAGVAMPASRPVSRRLERSYAR